jgi:8-oxo-dGTP diphosphatase
MRKCVAALIVQHQTILLGLRSSNRAFYPGAWDVFGGHVEAHESNEQALERELFEELGITPTHWEYLTTLAEPDPEQHGPGQYYFYRVTAWRGTPTNQHPAYTWLFAQFISGREPSDNEQ